MSVYMVFMVSQITITVSFIAKDCNIPQYFCSSISINLFLKLFVIICHIVDVCLSLALKMTYGSKLRQI